jgi:DMSO/TMAO reductase YedYZ molybdopterin-dependent catalytic subunit
VTTETVRPRALREVLPGAGSGVVAALVGLGVAELAAGIVPTGRSPVVAVADRVIHLGPGGWERFAIRVFGTGDKAALIVIVLAVILLVGALAGALAVRHQQLGRAVIAIGAGLGAWSGVVERDASWVHAVPPLLGGLATAWTVHLLALGRGEPTKPLSPSAADRRRLLLGGSIAASVAAVSGVTGRLLQGRVDASASRRAVVLPKPIQALSTVPDSADIDVPGVSRYITPNESFYRIDTALIVPQVETDGWELRIDGMVENPRTYTYEQLLARDLIEADVTLTCVSNEVGGDLIGNARWLGVPLPELLAEVRPKAGADQVVGRAVDGFTTGFPLSDALDGRHALLAIGMNGEPLPLRHGFPARLVVAGLYGYVSATKWLKQIELTRFEDYDAYWIQRGWAEKGPIKVQSRIDTPRGRVAAGTVPVAGVAWAQGRGIERVEVRVDGGRWHDATLAETTSVETWRLWRWDWDAKPGKHELAVRATAGDGEVQPEERKDIFPDGATGWHTVGVKVS